MRSTGNDGRADEVLDALLTAAAPVRTRRDAETAVAIDAMVDAARFDAASRRRGIARLAAIGAAGALLLSGAGAAVAVSSGYWSPWAEQPDGFVRFTVPSGAECEIRYGDLDARRDVAAAIRDFLGDEPRVHAALDRIDEEIVAIRAMPMQAGDEFGNSWDVGYGTEGYLSPDAEYKLAADWAVGQALHEHLETLGLDAVADGTTSSSQIRCSDGTY